VRLRVIFLLALIGTFILDQGIKDLFVAGYNWQGRCFSLELHYNSGVAFSFFASLGLWLKWIQALLIAGIAWYLFVSRMVWEYPLMLGMLLGAAVSNLYDRFIHPGVVDYFAWHCGFNYAIFNYADVIIDVAIGWILLKSFLEYRRQKKS
jgi:signal peptidase II